MQKRNQTFRRAVLAMVAALGVALAATGCSPGHDKHGNLDAAPNLGAAGGVTTRVVRDSWITNKVTAKLHAVDGVDNSTLHVTTNHGTVVLSGHADSQAAITAAVAATKSIKGVKHVDASQLTLSTPTHGHG